MSPTLGLYVHVPFCRTRCRYCDFYRVGDNRARMDAFTSALEREIDGVEEHHGASVDSVFFGGGTPSLLGADEVAALLDRLARRFELLPDCEISLEANPSDLDRARLGGYRGAGVNRLSIGVQSFHDRELELLGRRHDGFGAARCVELAREVGFDNVSFDLMIGVPAQTAAAWRSTVDRALALRPDHLSAYILEVHPRSEIDALRRRRPGLFPGEEGQRSRYELLATAAGASGYEHYEISNFALPGRRCRHNLKYWRCEPFLGFGPSAHSCAGGRRWRRPPDLVGYLEDPLAAEELPCDLVEERIFMGLRLREGVSLAALGALLPPDALEERLERLAPYVNRSAGRVRLRRSAWLVSTAVIAELLAPAVPVLSLEARA